jgi:hypothetical protein
MWRYLRQKRFNERNSHLVLGGEQRFEKARVQQKHLNNRTLPAYVRLTIRKGCNPLSAAIAWMKGGASIYTLMLAITAV